MFDITSTEALPSCTTNIQFMLEDLSACCHNFQQEVTDYENLKYFRSMQTKYNSDTTLSDILTPALEGYGQVLIRKVKNLDALCKAIFTKATRTISTIVKKLTIDKTYTEICNFIRAEVNKDPKLKAQISNSPSIKQIKDNNTITHFFSDVVSNLVKYISKQDQTSLNKDTQATDQAYIVKTAIQVIHDVIAYADKLGAAILCLVNIYKKDPTSIKKLANASTADPNALVEQLNFSLGSFAPINIHFDYQKDKKSQPRITTMSAVNSGLLKLFYTGNIKSIVVSLVNIQKDFENTSKRINKDLPAALAKIKQLEDSFK